MPSSNRRLLPAIVVAACLLTGCGSPDSQQPSSSTSAATPAGASADTVLASSRFIDRGGQNTSGGVQIERAGDTLRLVLTDDFETNDGPDLHVVLSPIDTAAAEGANAMADGAARIVGSLTSLSGAQALGLPNTDLSQFQSVLIHCIKYDHLYGAAPLELD
jgi:hypothetical protein